MPYILNIIIVIEMFKKQELNDKVRLLETSQSIYTAYYKLDDIIDSFYGPLVPSTGYLKVFDLESFEEGMLLYGPDKNDPTKTAAFVAQPKMFKAFTDYVAFNDIIGLGDVGILNKAIREKKAPMLINVAEALQERKLTEIANEIKARGAKIYGEVAGCGMSADAYHITATHPEGLGAKLVMQNALEDAGLKPEDIDYINAHGTSIYLKASPELIIRRALGSRKPRPILKGKSPDELDTFVRQQMALREPYYAQARLTFPADAPGLIPAILSALAEKTHLAQAD